MKVAFFGTPEFAVPALRRLIESPHEVVCVVTQPDKPSGRGLKLKPPPVKALAEEAGLPVHQPAKVKDGSFTETLRGYAPDVAVIVAYGKILPKDLLDVPTHGFLNIHASLLPKYRGAAPIQWAIAKGERETGVTIMLLDEGMDTGPIIAQRAMPILEDDDARSVANMLSLDGADLMMEVLADLAQTGSLRPQAQDNAQATHAPLISREDARIDWTLPAEEIIFRVRGFVVWPGAFTTAPDGSNLKITAAEACEPTWLEDEAWKSADVPPGTVAGIVRGRGFAVKTNTQGLLLVTRVKPENKTQMDAWSYVNGGAIEAGQRLK